MRGEAGHAVDEMGKSQSLIYGGFARTTVVFGTPTYMARTRTLRTGVQCTKQGSRAIFATFGPPSQLWHQVEICGQSRGSIGYRP